MLRTVLAVLLASALLGVALPVVDAARVAHADSQVQTELESLERTAADLQAESDPTDPGIGGARVERTLVLPGPEWGTASVERVEIPGEPGAAVRWRVASGATHQFRPSVPLVAPPDGLTLGESGRHRLRLELQRRDGRAVVVVSRAG